MIAMRFLATVAVLLALAPLLAAPAAAHAMLKHAEPAVGSTVKTAPTELRLQFSERIEPALSAVELRDAKGRRVETGALRSEGDGTVLVAPLAAPLAPGRYKISWRVLSVDTHVTHGDFSITVAP
jgi:methionine-rich copper-binding protein CopC